MERETYIQASELGEYVFCQHKWWLRRINGVRPIPSVKMQSGLAYHQTHWQQLRKMRQRELLFYFVLGAGLTILFLAMLWVIYPA